MIRDEELGLVDDWQLPLPAVALDDPGDLGRVELADVLGVLGAPGWKIHMKK